MSQVSRRQVPKTAAALSAATGPSLLLPASAQDVVNAGILHSLTGTIAIAEALIVDAEKLASDEIKASGGVLGKNDRSGHRGWHQRMAVVRREGEEEGILVE